MSSRGYRVLATVLISVLTFITLLCIFLFATPWGKSIVNQYDYTMEKVDEKTYEQQKEVEDTCRALIASYNTDKLTYEQYKNSSNSDECSWASSAKIRANQTASTYNNYILKNSFVWKNNVPSDIYEYLDYIV